MRTFFAPIVLARMGGESGDRIGAFGGELIPAIAAPSVPDPPRTTIRSGRRSWLSDLVESHLPEVTVVSRIQPLEPFVVSPNSLVLPVWAIGRSNDLPPSSLDAVLRQVSEAVHVPDFPSRALAAIRRVLVSDPFATRLLSEEARIRAASEESRALGGDEGVPHVIGLLPDRFTLGQLQAVVAGLLGRSPDDLESGSNFRRRTQELVHRRVLLEDESAASGHERGGRPARRFEFNGEAWKAWHRERFGGAARELEAAVEELRESQAMFANVSRWLERSADDAPWRPSGVDPEMPRLQRSIVFRAARDQETAESLESTHQRMARMERMIQALYRQSKESGPRP